MRMNKLSATLGYISLLLKKYNEQQQSAYRIIEIMTTPTGDTTLLIQVIGKTATFKSTPQEIVLNDQMLELFPKKDIRMITYLACAQKNKPKFQIVSQEFNEETNNINFKLRDLKSKNEFTINARNLTTDNNLIEKLSPKDIQSTSYIAGYEHAQQEKHEIALCNGER